MRIRAAILISIITATATAQKIRVTELAEKGRAGLIELRGLSAGPFDSKIWEAETLHFVPDSRSPLIEPREGDFRNIYAPSIVEIEKGWRIFYGAWDGVPSGNDRIYSALTADFLTITDRHTEIEHGPFQHVCNVSAARLPDNSFSLICTAYPDAKGWNKPIFFHSPDGKTWNGSPAPYTPKMSDIISIAGYEKYEAADINGINVVLYEQGGYRLYFSNFHDFGHVYRATSDDGKQYRFERSVLDEALMPNDVKKFSSAGKTWYLLGLHHNTDALYYSLSTDGLKFSPAKKLASKLGDADKFIVAIGFVTQGEERDRKVLGFLYGAGAVGSLDQNRIFARWLQRKVVLVTSAGRITADKSLGPDRQIVSATKPLNCELELYREDGKTPLGNSGALKLEPGKTYSVSAD